MSIFTQTIQVQLGGKSVTFKPDRSGAASTADGTFRVKNANPYGVIYGGMMEFEAVVSGPDWLAELQKLGSRDSGGPMGTFTLHVGPARLSATARITVKSP